MSTLAQNYQKEAKAAGFLRFAPRVPLVIATFIFTAIGTRFLFDPVHSAAAQGISFEQGVGITVARIGFGAFPLAFAIITLSCLVSKTRVLMGLYIVLTVITVALLVRIFGMIADNSVRESMRVLTPEVILMVASATALTVERRRQRHQLAD